MIDAGSTGSRIHAFKFEVEGEELTLLDSTFKAIEPGLSSFNEDPAQAGLSLVPLLDEAKAFVPAEIAGETTVELRATAGLRMLDPSEVQRILQEVHTVLQSYPFKVLDDAFPSWTAPMRASSCGSRATTTSATSESLRRRPPL